MVADGFDMCVSSQLKLAAALVWVWHPCSIRLHYAAGGTWPGLRENPYNDDIIHSTYLPSRGEMPRPCRAHHSTGKGKRKESDAVGI